MTTGNKLRQARKAVIHDTLVKPLLKGTLSERHYELALASCQVALLTDIAASLRVLIGAKHD